jgi:hypothetical protein
MNNSNNLLSNNSNNCYSGYSDYWRQFEPKAKTSSGSGFSYSNSSSSYSGPSNSNYFADKSTTYSSYHVPSFCSNSTSGLKIW